MPFPLDPWTSEESPPGSIPAATLIVLRDSPDGVAPHVLMVQRSATMRFAAGVVVFPGGRVDEGDGVLALSFDHGLALADAAARVAAIRETIEEAGVAVGLDPAISSATVAAIRAELHAGAPFGGVLADHGLSLDLSVLDPFARWCPFRAAEGKLSRIFDTRFYVARAPADAHLATADAQESVRLRWASAAEILSDCDAGREEAIYPTLRNLERLALGESYAAVLAHARAHPVDMVTPWQEEREGEPHLCIPDHLGYPVVSQAIRRTRRE